MRPLEVDVTSLLYDLPGFRVVSVTENEAGERRVVLMQVADRPGCPRCGLLVDGKPVAAEYRVSWWSVHRSLVDAAAARSSGLPPVRMLGLDETRARWVRWHFADGTGWRLTNPWMTSFVDLDTGRPGWLLGLVPGRSGTALPASWPPSPSRGGTVCR